MKGVFSFCVRRRKVVVLLTLALMSLGAYGYFQVARQENPDISTPVALVSVVCPGASAEEIENLVTLKVEEEAAKLDGVEYIRSSAGENLSVTIISIGYDVDKEKQWDTLKKNIDALKDKLPEDCRDPQIDTDTFVETAGMIVAVTGEGYGKSSLSEFAEEIKAGLLSVDGIKKCTVSGAPEERIAVELKTDILNRHSISSEDILTIFSARNAQIPVGLIRGESGNIQVTVPGSLEDIDEIENMVVQVSADGVLTRLRDVADVYFEEDPDAKAVYHNDRQAVLVAAYFEPSQNVARLGFKIEERLSQLEKSFPEGIRVSRVTYQPDDIGNSVSMFMKSLFSGILLVIIVVLAGMGVRNAVLVSLSIPASICATFVFMYLFRIPLHQVSLAGLVIALGMLVDNSVVVIDALQVRINNKEDPKEAAVKAAVESAGPVFSSTLTTAVAFATLFALPGEAREFVKTLPVVVIAALAASYMAAMFILPAAASKFLVATQPKIVRVSAAVRRFFSAGLEWGMKRSRALILYLGLLLLISAAIGVFLLPLKIFPNVDKDSFYIGINNNEKNSTESTAGIAQKVSRLLFSFPEITDVTYASGGYLPKLYLTSPMGFDSSDFIQVSARFTLKDSKSYKTREELASAVQETLSRDVQSADVSVNLFGITMPGPVIDIRLTGSDRDRLYLSAAELKEAVSAISGTHSVFDDISLNQHEYVVNIDNDMATFYGMTRYDVQRQMNICLSGAQAGVVRKSGREYPIFVKSDIRSLSDLENFKIKSSFTGDKIMLKQLGEVTLEPKNPSLQRYNRMPSVQITAEVSRQVSVQDVQREIEKRVLPAIDTEGMNIVFSGEKNTIGKYLSGLGIAAVLSLIAIYIILMIQFDSLLQALIIMATVPLSVIGSVAGLLICRQPFSFMAGLGIVSLIGIVVNNAILLVEYIRRARSEGQSVNDACRDAVSKRFRPILLSSVTTIIGLIPLSLSGSALFAPLAVSLMFGLLTSTGLTLIVIPSIYGFAVSGKK